MNRVPNPLIDSLADDLTPTRPLSLSTGFAYAAFAAVATAVIVELTEGLLAGATIGMASPMWLVVNGLLGVLAVACTLTVVNMVRPRVGNRHDAASGATAMLAVIPAAAIVTLLLQGTHDSVLSDVHGVDCMLKSLAATVLMAAALIVWLRRGAPVSLNAAGFYTGVAAGASGSLLYGLSCPLTGAGHLGIWHMVPVGIAAIVGRYAVPHLIRW